ncbi:MAG: DNA gyrase subunit A, partial [Patescibacteria group bacterium]|nr:DNA gyrase subunit A [Patescibacteria group bacterium]
MKNKDNTNKDQDTGGEEKKELGVEIGYVEPRDITIEMQESYMDYAMSVIVGRALPDVRDGLKPVHRRILYAMKEDGITHNAKYRKSASVVGSTLARYHPHGDMAVYHSMVLMAQDFSMRYPLVQGQGNFGSVDGDPPSAMRYSEARLSKIGEMMLQDIQKETVDFISNYDGTKKEPTVLPSPIPQLLLNGSLGIAVGMATNIPPHNIGEIVDAIIHLIENPKADTEDLFQFVKGPDFPTGGEIYNKEDIISAYSQGRGSITVRGKAEVVEEKGKIQIIITEIPYRVRKAKLVQDFAKLVQKKKLDGIKDIRDESDREGMRIVFDLKSSAYPRKILNRLYSFSSLQEKFHLNMIALIDGIQPRVMGLAELLRYYIDHRNQVIIKRTKFDLQKAKDRAHILEGLYKALSHIDEIIKTIKGSENKENAKQNLMKKFEFTEIQADAI